MKKILNFTIGADIELFLRNKHTNEIVSAEGLIKGTKDEPYVFDKSNKYFATSLDNVLAEFCIPPANKALDFYNAIEKCVKYIRETIPQELTTVSYPAFVLNDKWLQTEHAQLFGCEPDFNVWARSVNQRPEAASNLRSAGGHIHVGYDEPDMETNEWLIKALDLHLGVPSILQEPENERKSLYGKAGAFRFKDYGAEYRTISNYYLESKQLTEWAFNNTVAAIEWLNVREEKDVINTFNEWGLNIQNAINNNDKMLAETIINSFDINVIR